MKLKLVMPDEKYLSSVQEAIIEYRSEPSKFEINAVRKMIIAQQNNFAEYFKNTQNEALGLNLRPGYVAHTIFWLIDNDNYIGTFNLRHNLTPALEQIGGHIAYQIRPSKQRKGYAYAGLKLCLDEAHKIGIKKVLITCEIENVASYSVMHKAMLEFGGYEDKMFMKDNHAEKRVWIRTDK